MQFICPHCQQELEIGTVYGGQSTRCPECQGEMLIPTAAPSTEPRAPQSEPPATPPTEIRLPLTEPGKQEPQVPSPEEPGDAAAGGHVDSAGARDAPEPGEPGRPMTISQYMAEHDMGEGSVQLDDSAADSASDVLTSEQGRRRYEIGEQVAQGGQGAIMDAKDINLRRSVAMKVMLDPEQVTREESLRFIHEAQITSQLQHPSIVPIHELGVDASGNVFYTMKFVGGDNLKDILCKIRDGDTGTIKEYPLMRLLSIFQRICDAIAFAHSKRVIHRDLKPENIMVGEYGEVLVMDWGLAKVLPKRKRKSYVATKGGVGVKKYRVKGSAADQANKAEQEKARQEAIDSVSKDVGADILKTMDGMIMGTPGFMAPEQAGGEVEKLDERTDIYALGCILYNILTLHLPITSGDLDTVLERATSGEIPHPSAYNTGTWKRKRETGPPVADQAAVLEHCPNRRIPDSLSAVTMKALSLRPIDRYQSVKSLQRDIEAYQNGFATGAEQASFGKQARLLIKRHKGITATAAAAFVVLMGVVGTSYWLNLQERLKAEKERERTKKALVEVKQEQKKRRADRKESAPAILETARFMVQRKDFRNALATVRAAIDYDGELAPARLLHAMLLVHEKKWKEAVGECRWYSRKKPHDADAKRLFWICRVAVSRGADAAPVGDLAAIIGRLGAPTLAAEFAASTEERLELFRARIEKVWPGRGGNLSLGSNGAFAWSSRGCEDIADLTPLKGMPLSSIDLTRMQVRDLTPLAGMGLREIRFYGSKVTDLSPLEGMPLRGLTLMGAVVADLSPLKGMPLTDLTISVAAADLTPLRGIALSSLSVSGTTVEELSVLKGMRLTKLELGAARLRDITALAGMDLVHLRIHGSKVVDLTALRGMKLTQLNLYRCAGVSDLTPLSGMPLTHLDLGRCAALKDLSPLRGMPLASLIINDTKVTDLTPLRGMTMSLLSLTPKKITTGMDVVRSMTTLEKINGMRPAEFWKKYDAGAFK